jgi:hypothetical protein
MLQFQTNNDDKLEFKQRNWEQIIEGAKGWEPNTVWLLAGAASLGVSCFTTGWVEFSYMAGAIASLCCYCHGWIQYHRRLTAQAFDENRWQAQWDDTFRGKTRSPEMARLANEWLKGIERMRSCNDNNVKNTEQE